MTTIIYAHPYVKSFNHAVLETLINELDSKSKKYNLIDLYADGFNPVVDADSLRLYSRGETNDPLVTKYLDILIKSDELFIISPVWWAEFPAIVKGFFDKVMLVGHAYKYSDTGNLIPDKININRTVIFTTTQSPTEYFAPYFLNYFKPMVLDAVGMLNMEWYNCTQTAHGPEQNRIDFLKLVKEKA